MKWYKLILTAVVCLGWLGIAYDAWIGLEHAAALTRWAVTFACLYVVVDQIDEQFGVDL